MPLTDAGRNLFAADIIGEAITEYNNANATIGVGDSNAAFAAAQVDLQAAVNKFRKAMDATFPSRAVNVLTFRSTFAAADANFNWREWGVFNAGAGGTMLNRKAEDLGVKGATQTWQFTVALTVGNP